MSALNLAENRRRLERLYGATGSGATAAALAGIPHSTAYDYLRRRGLVRTPREAVALATAARHRKSLERGVRLLRALPGRTITEAADATGVARGTEYRLLRAACAHLELDYHAVLQAHRAERKATRAALRR